ncbi:MAG: stage II sporulation protein P [Agathobacter sp.]|nr:stage II sporulation protein P [Agathobacter sp.]
MLEQVYVSVSKVFFPHVYLYEATGDALVYRDVEQMIIPVVSSYRVTSGYQNLGQEDTWIELQNGEMQDMENANSIEGEKEVDEVIIDSGSLVEYASGKPSSSTDIQGASSQKKEIINRTKLQDFDYLRQMFYQVDNTTTVDSNLLDVNKLLTEDMTLKKKEDGPQILIYHTHSQEAYADSLPGDASTSVVALGDYLAQILSEQYGVKVLHHTGQYDVINRDGAYAEALPSLEKIISDNPSIEVVIDIHRDGVPATTHLVTEIEGKPTAQIMFFNGLSHTTALGDLEYLANPYIPQNLAFSFQMQLAAAEYYPEFTRRIYLKGYRYNMHLLPKSLLVEVGAQTNTFQEAKNAMKPLADILVKVLKGE